MRIRFHRRASQRQVPSRRRRSQFAEATRQDPYRRPRRPASSILVHARAQEPDLSLGTAFRRTVPPLRPEVVVSLVRDFPQLRFTLNGGVTSLEEVHSWIAKGVHGVMIGRRALRGALLFAQWTRTYFALPGSARE